MLLKNLLNLVLFAGLLLIPTVLGFGLTESGNSFIVDTEGGLIFTVDKTNGDITSMKFNGIEAQDSGSKKSHIASGIGATCSWVRTGNSNNYIKITCTAGTLTHYIVARYKDPAIHMATYISAEPSVGELRFIARLSKSTLPNGYAVSSISGGTAIEGSDVFKVGSQTRSKFYSSRQFIDDQVHGVTGSGIGVYMVIPGTGYESSSGGPFMRDINNQGGDQQELYFYMNSGHTQTESYRMGLHGPYALWFTTGAAPSASIDTAFWAGLSVTGFIPQASRGRVTGKASGIPSNFASLQVVGFSNSAAQYWVRTDSSGSFTSPYMKPGTYTMTLYKVELAVASQSVTVSAGGVTTSNIASKEATPSVIWQIGDFDGTPRGFLNADIIETAHPSDSRMHSWGPVTYTIGQQDIGYFPMAAFKGVGPVTVRFALASGQGGARTLQIATTLAFAGGRPQVVVNGWTGPAPAAPSQPDSRGVTRGTWRGNNNLYTVNIPDGVLYTGSTVNVITINVISGSSGDLYLSPNFVFDALRLY
ncbi:putative rhamnogalacturonate lyase A [Hypsizygus marmoreus]|uniref:rhamnogalacturonan endolyase n=1 Tax=Hypsizygus marmoreus TaxID=39966 RepID=A0A369KA71_HYPMA|nr:putative rhamnogalacturonate lyase A [Hypsizygus marmoreus]